MGIRAGLGPRRGGGIRERLEVGLRARAGETATASLGDGREGVGLVGEDEDGRKREERWRRNSQRKGERERLSSKVEGRRRRKGRYLFIFLFSFFFGCCKFGLGRERREARISFTHA